MRREIKGQKENQGLTVTEAPDEDLGLTPSRWARCPNCTPELCLCNGDKWHCLPACLHAGRFHGSTPLEAHVDAAVGACQGCSPALCGAPEGLSWLPELLTPC